MKLSKHLEQLHARIVRQRAWIEKCGGTLAGYIAAYGDPGVPPLNPDGAFASFALPEDKQHLFPLGMLTPVPDQPGRFYKRHFGDGGTAIYKADTDHLAVMEAEYDHLSTRYHAAARRSR